MYTTAFKVVLPPLENEWSNPPYRTPNLRQLHGRLRSPSGWDRIDNLTEKAHQAPAACTARLAPFGACCIIQRQTSRQIRFTRNPEMANPWGHGEGLLAVASGLCYRAAAPITYPSHGHASPTPKALPHEATTHSGHLTFRHSADFSLPTASLGLG